MRIRRVYNHKDVDMLMSSKIISESFKNNISELSLVRTNWTEEFVINLIKKIDDAIENYLGVDSKKELRKATADLNDIQVPAQRDLSFFKTQIDEDFKHDADRLKEIHKQLGFTTHLRKVQKGDQEALIQLLYTFKKNITDSLKEEITSNGTSPALIDKIIAYAEIAMEANTTQEYLKETTKEISKEITDTFNDIYTEIIGICKIASNYFKNEPLKKEQFTFSKIISNMNFKSRVEEPENIEA